MTRSILQFLFVTLINATVAMISHAQDWGTSPGSSSPWSVAPGSFYGQVDVLFWMQESQFDNQPIVNDPNTGATYLATSDLDSSFAPGIRATVGMSLCCGQLLEFSYLGLYPGSESAVAVRPGPDAFLTFPGNLFGNAFVDFDSARATLGSAFNGLEANLPGCRECCEPCCCDPCCEDSCCGDACCCGDKVSNESLEWFAGVRYINFNQDLDLVTQRMIAGGTEEGVYNVRTVNNLYGLQVGARARKEPDRFGWEATGKVGIFANDARQEQTVTDFPDFVIRPTVSASDTVVAFVGETNLTALYRLSDVWNLRAGYSAVWITGLALAPDQLDFNFAMSPSGDQLHSDGWMLLHGLNIGLEAGW